MFDNLTARLTKTLENLRGRGRITEDNIGEAMREVRVALLEADVALPVIKTFIESVKAKALGAEVASSLTADLMDIRGCADRAALLTRQLLAVSRKQAIEPRPLDLSSVVTNLGPLIRRMLPESIGLDLRCEANLPAVFMDPIELERVGLRQAICQKQELG